MFWYVIYSRPQQEKKIVLGLTKLGIECYCPMIEETRQWSDRKKKIEVPLIKSYVFVKIAIKDRNRVFEVPGVMRYLFWLGKLAEIKEKEIEQLRTYLASEYKTVKVENYLLGSKYTIKDGLFEDHSGTIVKLNTKYVTVYLEQLGATVTISL